MNNNYDQELDKLISISKLSVRLAKFGKIFCLILSILLLLATVIVGITLNWLTSLYPFLGSIVLFVASMFFNKSLKVSKENIKKFEELKKNYKKPKKK